MNFLCIFFNNNNRKIINKYYECDITIEIHNVDELSNQSSIDKINSKNFEGIIFYLDYNSDILNVINKIYIFILENRKKFSEY